MGCEGVPELQIIPNELWTKVQQRQHTLMECYAGSGRVSRGAHSAHLLSGLLICKACGGQLIVISGTGKYTTYGCSRAFNRTACTNRARIKEGLLEELLFAQLQTAFNTPEVLNSIVGSLVEFQTEMLAGTETAQRMLQLGGQLQNLIGELAQLGGSPALRLAIREREAELKGFFCSLIHDVLNGREVVIEGSRFSRRVTLPRTHLESRSSSLSLTIHQVLELRRRTSPASAAAGNEVAMQIESL
jgi:hypothetical protein